MSGVAANVIGLIGGVLFIGAFAYANVTATLDKLWFNALNLAGSILLLISLSVHFNLPATLLEAAWGLIAAGGLIAELRRRARRA